MLQGLILTKALSSVWWQNNEKIRKKEKRKKEKRSGWELFSDGWSWTHLTGSAGWDFCGCQIQLKDDLLVNLWILSVPNVMVVIILARSNQNYPSVAPASQGGFWSHRAFGIWFPILAARHFDIQDFHFLMILLFMAK
jgi:hypothetical protein